jgi:hypothetical protein
MNTLTQHKTYKATITLGVLEQYGTNNMIANELTKVGFANVQVTGSGKERIATGVWRNPTVTGPLPEKAKKYIKEIVEL